MRKIEMGCSGLPMIFKSVLLIVLVGLGILNGCSRSERGKITIGSKNFTEQVLLGEILAQLIENRTGLKVERKLNLGGTFICHQALRAGEIDLYVEYTGTALTAILKHKPDGDAEQVYRTVKDEYREKFNLEWLPPLGFNNTFAIIVRGEDAKRLGLKTLSQAAEFTPGWQAGFGYEFTEREDGYPGLAKTYGLKFRQSPKIMDLGLMYRALTENQVDLVAGNSTDGLIASLGLAVLEDDRHYFPPYYAAAVVREETLENYPELREALEKLSGQISEEEMRNLNYEVDGDHTDIAEVAKKFLTSKGLLR